MAATEIILWVALVVLLGCYIYIKHRQWVRGVPHQDDPEQWSGKAIDVTPLQPKVEAVRRNHLAARTSVAGVCFHRALLELARQAVARLGYFHDREPESHAQAHGH